MGALKRLAISATGLLALLILSGCFFGGRYIADEPIGKKRVARIVAGQTSTREVMTWLGPPLAIARQGKTVIVPVAGAARAGSREMQSESFFELFPAPQLRKEEAVYYFDAAKKTSFGGIVIMILLNVGGMTEQVKAERLWLLVDERTGIIEDCVYRDASEEVRPGPSGSAQDQRERTP